MYNVRMQFKSISVLIVVFLTISAAILYYFVSSPSLTTQNTQPKNIAVLVASDLQLSSAEGVKDGLRELGYMVERDFIISVNNPKGDRNLTVQMAKDIVASKPDMIISLSTTATSAIKDADKDAKIPVVFGDVGNFRQLGIENIKRPGGHMTGVVVDNVPLAPKRMGLLSLLIPNIKTIGILVNPKHVSYEEIIQSYGEGASKLGIKLSWYRISSKEDIPLAMEKLVKDGPDAFMTTSEAAISNNPELITPILKEAKIPSMDFNIEVGAQSGYLMAHGASRYDTGRQSARLAAKVLGGENPGNIPIEFISSPVLEINMALANEMDIKIPESLLLQANKIYR